MKSLFTAAAVFIMALVLWGCPYKSTVGIDDEATIKIDPALTGTWHRSDYPEDSTELVFKKLSGKKYTLTAKITDGQGGYQSSTNEAWFSKAGKWTLMSFYDPQAKEYFFGEVELKGGKLTIKFLSEDITAEQFTSTAAMSKFIAGLYAENRVLYDDDIELNDLEKMK